MTASVTEVHELLNRTVEVATALGREDVAAVVRRAPTQLLTETIEVVVAGESQRGKSRLINAILGQPGLSPVGDASTTGCPIRFEYAEARSASLMTSSVGAASNLQIRTQEISFDSVCKYACIGGNNSVSVEIRLPAPVLEGMALVDTPGISGLDTGRVKMTLESLSRADALLFVCDASQPIMLPELAFLRRAAGMVTTIVLVITKIDQYPLYESIVSETRDLLAKDPLLRSTPVVAVSSSTADLATSDRAGKEAAAMLRQYSGVESLIGLLDQEIWSRASRLKINNALRLINTAVRYLGEFEKWLPTGMSDSPEELARLRKRYELLRSQLGDEQAVRIGAQHHLHRMRVHPRHHFDDKISLLRRQYREEAATGLADKLVTLPSRFESDIAAATHEALDELAKELVELGSHLADRLGYEQLEAEFGSLISADVASESFEASEGSKSKIQSAMTLLSGLRIGTFIATPTGVLGAMGVTVGIPVMLPIALGSAVAVAGGWWLYKATSVQSRRTHLRGWVDSVSAEAKAVFARALEDRVLEVQHHVDLTLPTLIRERISQIRALDVEAEALVHADREQRSQVRVHHEQRMALIAELADSARVLKGRLDVVALVDSGASGGDVIEGHGL